MPSGVEIVAPARSSGSVLAGQGANAGDPRGFGPQSVVGSHGSEAHSAALDLALALDPVQLAIRAGVIPDPWQAGLLRSQERQLLMLCARQTGKSTVAALLAVHEALYRSPALVLLLAPAQRQAQELFRAARGLYRALGETVSEIEEESALRLELGNGSRIISLPGSEATVRTFSNVALLVLDEAARVPDDLYAAVRPMLAVSGGRLVLLSTPFGKRGFFWREWSEGDGWVQVKVTAEQCPRISRTFLEQERASIGDWWYSQEYECVFRDPVDSAFSTEHIAAALDDTIEPLFPPGGTT